jgi:hypothetical protein
MDQAKWGMAPFILNLDTRWVTVVSFVTWLLYLCGRASGLDGIGGWVGCRACLDSLGKREISCCCWESNQESLDVQPCPASIANSMVTRSSVYIIVLKVFLLESVEFYRDVCACYAQ